MHVVEVVGDLLAAEGVALVAGELQPLGDLGVDGDLLAEGVVVGLGEALGSVKAE